MHLVLQILFIKQLQIVKHSVTRLQLITNISKTTTCNIPSYVSYPSCLRSNQTTVTSFVTQLPKSSIPQRSSHFSGHKEYHRINLHRRVHPKQTASTQSKRSRTDTFTLGPAQLSLQWTNSKVHPSSPSPIPHPDFLDLH